MAVIVAALVSGFVLLFLATITLVYLNWSDNVAERVLSIALIGIATILAAVVVTLKESSIEAAFTTPVVLDVVDGAPPIIVENPGSKLFVSNLRELVSLGRPARTHNGLTVMTVSKPTEAERFAFCGELLQYRVLVLIRKLQHGGWKFGMEGRNAIATVAVPMKLTEARDYPGALFMTAAKVNRFSDSDQQDFEWAHTTFTLPIDTRVSLIYHPAVEGPEERIVRLEKPPFFRIDFVISPLGGTGSGIVPEGVILSPEWLARCQTFQFQVTMHATFERITAGNWRTEEYKNWAAWLFDRLKENLEVRN